LRIVGDVGGTHARFALLDVAGEPVNIRSSPSADFAGPVQAVERFLADLSAADAAPSGARPRELALAIAGPAQGETFAFTNLHWSFSRRELRQRLGLARLEILNDFEALALSIPHLVEGDREEVKAGKPAADAPIVVLGPGTGLGAAALVPVRGGYQVVPGEGGHRDLAASTEEEWQVVRRLAARFGGHVSVERALSGPGLENLHRALGEIHGHVLAETNAAEVARLSRSGEALPRRATDLFSGWLGALAGDLALAFGARGGVWLAGGVLGGLGEAFRVDLFRERFLAKGRMRGWLEPIPVWRIVRENAALLGCAARLAG
jgi:glucokinase